MILSLPRIIAIDDAQKDLDGLTRGLNQLGLACLPFHFTGDTEDIRPCPHVRVIFADLHLNESGAVSDHAQDFSRIGGLIEQTIMPSGPYVLILWTRYSDQADKLRQYLDERLRNTSRPLAVKSIDKMHHLDSSGKIKSTKKLVTEITNLFAQQPQITALLGWETRVLGAAAETVSSIFNLAAEQNSGNDVGRLLAHLAVGAVGKTHVEKDRFHAVNEALLPILTDRIAALRSKNENKNTWKKAFKTSDTGRSLFLKEVAELNRLIHIAPQMDRDEGTRRGVVIALPKRLSERAFRVKFGIEQDEAALKQFFCKGFVEKDERFRWVLVQCQASCDYAQNQPGPLPYYLGLELPVESKDKDGKPPVALWTSPPFESAGEIRLLHVNARFQVSLSLGSAKRQKSLYRLREQLLNELVYQIHSYGARPGILSYREFRPRQEKSGKQSHRAKRE